MAGQHHTVHNGGEASSQRGQREIQPTGWKSTVVQNEIGTHNQQNTWGRHSPKTQAVSTAHNMKTTQQHPTVVEERQQPQIVSENQQQAEIVD